MVISSAGNLGVNIASKGLDFRGIKTYTEIDCVVAPLSFHFHFELDVIKKNVHEVFDSHFS